jgi:hypothetical protein
MRISQRILTLGLATTLGLGVLAPMASAKDNCKTDVAIGLGAATVALLATHHYAAGAVGVGLTILAAEPHPCRPICVEPVVRVERFRPEYRRDFRARGRW